MTVTYGYDKKKITASKETLNAIAVDMLFLANMYEKQGKEVGMNIYKERYLDIFNALNAVRYYDKHK